MPIEIPHQFRRLLDCLPIAAYLLDPKTRCVVAANSLFCGLIGFTEQELRDLPWPRILMPDFVVPAELIIKNEEKTEAATEWHFQRKDGSPLQVYGKYRLTQVTDDDHWVHELYFTVCTPIEEMPSALQFIASSK